tara:strand:- start:59 stop:514 length:456 start_codon:yes stop_codon:yes gene_type:complete
MPIGNMLSENEQQYVALRDDATNTWRILNTWHDEIRSFDAESEIPDESPAVTVFSEGQFLALIKEAGRLGVLANASFGVEGVDPETELDMGILDRDKEIAELREKISTLEDEKSQVIRDSSHTEDYELKERAMANILKLVSMQDMSNLSKE